VNWNGDKHKEYPKDEILDAVFLSGAAYCDAKSINHWDCAVCSDKLRTYSNVTVVQSSLTKTLGYVAYDASSQRVLISFRGTDPSAMENVMTDLLYHKVPCKASLFIQKDDKSSTRADIHFCRNQSAKETAKVARFIPDFSSLTSASSFD
jgi:hypothetical protein